MEESLTLSLLASSEPNRPVDRIFTLHSNYSHLRVIKLSHPCFIFQEVSMVFPEIAKCISTVQRTRGRKFVCMPGFFNALKHTPSQADLLSNQHPDGKASRKSWWFIRQTELQKLQTKKPK